MAELTTIAYQDSHEKLTIVSTPFSYADATANFGLVQVSQTFHFPFYGISVHSIVSTQIPNQFDIMTSSESYY